MKKEKREKHFIKRPYYEGGLSAMRLFIKQHLKYPEKAKAEKIEGSVFMRYTINHEGKVIATKIISGIGYGCDEEAIRLVKLLQFKVPKNRNLKAVFHKDLQIHFRLPKEKPVEAPSPTPAITSIQYSITPAKKEEKAAPKEKKQGGYNIIINL